MHVRKALSVITAAIGAAALSPSATAASVNEFNHVVVIYQENHSFDNLYSLWGEVHGKSVEFQSAFKNQPFNIDDYIQPTDTTCPAPGVSAANGVAKGAGLPGGCTRDLVHRFYNEQYQINQGKQNRYVTGSDAAGLVMGYYNTKKLPIYDYLQSSQAPKYVIADRFFQAAFGGSFLNHQWLIAAATPVFVGAPNDGGANDLHSVADENGMPTATPLYTSPLGASAKDSSLTASCAPPAGRPATPKNIVCGDYAVNTTQPFYWPYSPGTVDARRLPPLTNPTIGDRLSAAGVDWAWYSGGWSNANGDKDAPGWTNGSGPTCSDPNANTTTVFPLCPDKLFQYHHQAFNYFANYAPGTTARADHLRDEAEFITAAQNGDLKPVSFVKPIGEDNEHPGYTGEAPGSDHLVDLIDAVIKGPQAHDTLIIVTYDEFGGQWDHVPPPPYRRQGLDDYAYDQWGPGTRIPALLIAKKFEHSAIDHTDNYDTTSIIKLIEERFHLTPLGSRDRAVRSLERAIKAAD